ncbi:MAG: dihydrodipicolinate synthase family protein [Acetobacteraceae bacterium]
MNFLVRGNVPAIVTPFSATGDLMLDAYAALVRWHLEQGADGLCVAGDNGEIWSLSAEERRQLAATTVSLAAGRVPVVMGVSSTTAKQTIAYAEQAAAAGVDALMIGPQSYVMKATTKELVQRMEAIHRAVPLPIVLYNSPRRTNISLTIESMTALTEAVNIIALKEASRDFFYLTHVIQHFADRLAVMVGPAPYILPGLALGAAGFISSGPELLGGVAATLMQSARAAPTPALRETQYRLTRVYETLMSLGTWPAALKAGHRLIGREAGIPRDPVLALDEDGVAALAAVLRACGAPLVPEWSLAAE